MPFNCKTCTQEFESKSKLDYHRIISHQRKAKLFFQYGICFLILDGTRENYEVQEGATIQCPRCEANFRSFKYLRQHSRKSCKGPIANVEPEPTISAPLDSCWNPINGTGSFLYLHNELGVVLCRAHNTCVPKEFLASHLQKQHHVSISIPDEILSRINETNSETLEVFYNRPFNAIIPNIKVLHGYFKCPCCPKIYSKKRTAVAHFKSAHTGITVGDFVQVDCQTLFQHPGHLRYFTVGLNNVHEETDAPENNDSNPPAANTDQDWRMVPLVERVTNWNTMLATFNAPRNELYARFIVVSDSEKANFDILEGKVLSLVTKLNQKIKRADQFKLRMVGMTSDRESSMTSFFKCLQSLDSLKKYASTIAKLVHALNKIGFEHLNFDRFVSNPLVATEEELIMCLKSFLFHAGDIVEEWGEMPALKAAMLLCLKHNAQFKDPGIMSQTFAHLMFVIRALVLNDIHPNNASPDSSLVFSRVDQNTVFGACCSIIGLLRRLDQENQFDSYGICWDIISDTREIDFNTLIMRTITYSIQNFKDGYNLMLKKANDIIASLACGMSVNVPSGKFMDRFQNFKVGYNFMDDPDNQGLINARNAYLYNLQRHYSNFQENARRTEMTGYCSKVKELVEILLLLVHFSGGGPARATELMGLQFKNADISPRNVFYDMDTICVVQTYNKSDLRTGSSSAVPRYLPVTLAKILLKYGTCIRPAHQ